MVEDVAIQHINMGNIFEGIFLIFTFFLMTDWYPIDYYFVCKDLANKKRQNTSKKWIQMQ